MNKLSIIIIVLVIVGMLFLLFPETAISPAPQETTPPSPVSNS
ncbi:hypothetical protein [Legionella sp. 31fI33]|nr:hypothetical protein [Legionella sp. 31fI33]